MRIVDLEAFDPNRHSSVYGGYKKILGLAISRFTADFKKVVKTPFLPFWAL